MSGGGNKKKMMRTQGWEEAGSEFYQESYPTDAEFDVLQRDPRHLATLLPSKQTRAATTLRFRTNDNRTIARRQTAQRNRWESIGTRGTSTVGGDVQVSMMPDLSGDVANEQTTWEKIMDIKVLPVPMAHKREMKSKILNQPNLRLQGYEELNWKRRKMWRQFQTSLKETYDNLTLWKGSLKKIEGQFGTGVVAYFLFLKYLLILNFFIFLMVFSFITLPTILLDNPSDCNSPFNILDLLQGTGFMECTLLYYGTYPREIFSYTTNGTTMYYNIPLAYICVYLICFAVPLICIVRSGANGLKERLIEGEGQFYQYCNLIFGGWDFCIQNEKSARIKHKALYNEIAQCLEAERSEEQRQNRTRNQIIKLYTARVIVNIIVVGVLVACGCGIYFVFDYCTNAKGSYYEELLFQFLPSITIVGMNMLVPFLFKYLISFEEYSPAFVIRMMLGRTVILRLSSIFTLCVSLKNEIDTFKEDQCWETFVGQQIYKLVLTDFATVVLLTFVLNYPRALLARKFNKNSFFVIIGDQTFDLPKHVLDVVYSQTLCWLGCFYAPLLTVMFTIIFFLVFIIKKFACLQNSNPSSTIYRASRSESMFMIVLLFSFVSAFVPLAFSISDIKPSPGCGPFRGLQSVWSEITKMFLESPIWIQDITAFLTTTGFAIPLFIVLFMSFYYYRAVNAANRHMVSVLKNQLVLEGHDKQFLLERLSRLQIGDNTISTTN